MLPNNGQIRKANYAKERGDNLRNWADFTYPTNQLLLFQKFYYWAYKSEEYTYLVPVYWETREDIIDNDQTIKENFLYKSQLLTFSQHGIPMVTSNWSNLHIVWGFPFYFRYLVARVTEIIHLLEITD